MSVRKFSGFDSTGSDTVGAPEVSAARVKKEPRFFSEGLHTVKIASVEDKGDVSTDSSWSRLWVKLEGTGEKTTYTGVMLPTESLLFKGEANSYVAQTFLSFVKALGYSTDPRTLPDTLNKLFGKEDALVGKELQVQIGYKGNHLVLKDKKLHLVQKYGRPILKDGEPAVFSEREEAKEWAVANKIELQSFPEVVAFVPAEKLTTSAPTKRAESNNRAAF